MNVSSPMLKKNLHFHRAGMKEAEHGLNKSLPGRDSRSYGQEGLGIKREGIWEIIKGKSLEQGKKIRQRENILSSMQIRMQLGMCSEKSKGLPNGKSEIGHRKETIQRYFSYENTKRYPW